MPSVFNHKLSNYGGGERDRTDDLLRARQALSHLSYTPHFQTAKDGKQRADTPNPNCFQCSAFRFLIWWA